MKITTSIIVVTLTDHLSIIYLHLLLRLNPNDAALRMTLAKQQDKLGALEEAVETLKPVLNQKGPEATEARVSAVQIGFKRYFSGDLSQASREAMLSALKKKTESIAKESIRPELLPAVIKLALALDLPAVAGILYEHWASIDPVQRYKCLKEAGRWHMASGNPLMAARIYKQAFETYADPNQVREFALLSIEAMRAADLGKMTLNLARNIIKRFPEDRELLDVAVRLALESNNAHQALQWGQVRLSLDPDDPKQIASQTDLALAAGDLPLAFGLVRRLIELDPSDSKARARMAQIAEWSDNPSLALEQWVWLAHRENDDVALDHALRLAKGLNHEKVILELVSLRSKSRALTGDEVAELLLVYNDGGDAADLVAFFETYLKHYPGDKTGWHALASTQAALGRLDAALATWRHIETQFETWLIPVVGQAEVMRRMGNTEDAFTLLVQNQERATIQHVEYWNLFGSLAWELAYNESALLAYRTLWKSHSPDGVVSERLIHLARKTSHPKEAVTVAEQAYYRFKEPRWLLLAMDAALEGKLWQELRGLDKIANTNPQPFQGVEMYWLLRAQLAVHEGQFFEALTHYNRALEINPGSTVAKAGLLWAAIDQDQNHTLSRYLNHWRKQAETQPELWGAFGVGMVKLGRPGEALFWYERKAQSNPNDYLWLLSYADTLGQVGRADAAWRIRRRVLGKLRKQFEQDPKATVSETVQSLQRAYVALARDMEGAAVERRILAGLLARGVEDPLVREMIIAAHLSQKNFDAARFWLMKTHASRRRAPAWQRLAVALADHDYTAVEHILEVDGTQITPQDRIQGLRTIGRSAEAFTLTHELFE